ncbi:MAG: acyl transferase [Bacteroidota bacterium]
MNTPDIFNINSNKSFEDLALKIFKHQAKNNAVYKEFISYININPLNVNNLNEIPFLPIQFFKTHKIISTKAKIETTFLSSGTTGMTQSKHHITDISIYEKSFKKGFHHFYGNDEEYIVLALLPSYLERNGSSLIYMVTNFIKNNSSEHSGFYLKNLEDLAKKLRELDTKNKKILLIGVSYALLDLIEKYRFSLKNTIIMETGGMKGRRKELIRKELHHLLLEGFGVEKIHSEYGMTELLSQAYSKGNGVFFTPPWMKVMIRDTEDALTLLPHHKTGGINIIDLANINSCSFIATQDLGKTYPDNSFEIMGRFDNSDIRGCNLMVV